jgi:hypothetical protein
MLCGITCAGTHYEAMDWSPSGPASGSSTSKSASQQSIPTGVPFLFYTAGSALPSAQPPMPAHSPDQFRWDPNAFGGPSSTNPPSFGSDKSNQGLAVAEESFAASAHHESEEKPVETGLIQRREIATGAVDRERRRRQKKGKHRRRSFAIDNDQEGDDDEESAKLDARRQVHQHFALHNYNYGDPATADRGRSATSVWWKGDTPYIIAGHVATISSKIAATLMFPAGLSRSLSMRRSSRSHCTCSSTLSVSSSKTSMINLARRPAVRSLSFFPPRYQRPRPALNRKHANRDSA